MAASLVCTPHDAAADRCSQSRLRPGRRQRRQSQYLCCSGEFGIASTFHQGSWIIEAINAAAYPVAPVFDCELLDRLNSWFGQRGTAFIAACFLIVSSIGSRILYRWQADISVASDWKQRLPSCRPLYDAFVCPKHPPTTMTIVYSLCKASTIVIEERVYTLLLPGYSR
jgi:hypothetical protein